jgi:hypothetical protein
MAPIFQIVSISKVYAPQKKIVEGFPFAQLRTNLMEFFHEKRRTRCHFLQTPVGRIMINFSRVEQSVAYLVLRFVHPSKIFVWGA